jgi:arylsulfatase A-like enzyme
MRTRALGAGIAGGMLAGALVGVAEALTTWAHAHGAGELPPIAWAIVAYGAVGGLGGLGAGIAALVLGADGFALAFAGVGWALGTVVGRFRIFRDVFMEQVPSGTERLIVNAGVPLGLGVLALVVWWFLRGAEARRRLLTRPAVATLVLGALAAGWVAVAVAPGRSPEVTAPTTRASGPNIVLIAVDTLRADRLSAYGYKAQSTPNIDRLAADGIRYAHTFSQASWTRPSFGTIFSGLYPSSHGAMHKADSLPSRVQTVAETLASGGYYTVGFPNNANISPAFNFQQGFAEYHYLAPDLFFLADEPAAQLALYNGLRLVRERFLARRVDVHNYYQPAEVVTARVRGWLEANATRARPFFLFVHYMDPHDPYMVHPFDGQGYARVANPDPPADVAEKYSRLYDGEVAYLDHHMGALLDDLRARGLYDGSLIVLTGDHGEEFHEHGGWWHGTTLYDEQIHVPLIIKPPAGQGTGGRVVDELATHLDIMPTIVATAGLPPAPQQQGHALPLGDAPTPTRASVFSEESLEGNDLQSVRTPTWKLIVANPGNPRGLPPEELFDVSVDPGERHDLAASRPEETERMRAARGRAILEARAFAGAGERGTVDAATQERLKSLGYIH